MTPQTRRTGIICAILVVGLQCLYVITLVLGLLARPLPTAQIGDPFFTLMEGLILLMMPPLVLLMIVIHLWAAKDDALWTMAATIFTALTASLTMAVHSVIMTLSRHADFAHWSRALSFEWPSPVYVIDILAWDVFFALAMLFAASAFRGGGFARWIRYLLIAGGALAALGLVGVGFGNMTIRNVGIIGYAGLFPFAALLFAAMLQREAKY